MIKVISTSTGYAPVITCDSCEQRIVDASQGVVIYPSVVDEGENVAAYHAHKGECDRSLTAQHGDDGGTDELHTHLAWLLQNVGLCKVADVERAFRTAAMIESIG